MSAYIVSDATIGAIVTFAIARRISVAGISNGKPADHWVPIGELCPHEIGAQLAAENYASVNHRYRENDTAPRYRHSPVIMGKGVDGKTVLIKPIDIIKLCHCLDYQSCEHPGWQTSWAKRFLDDVIQTAIMSLPGYDAAPWGLN